MTSGLRIALIASSRFPIREPFAGGLEAHICHLARALADRGHEVSLFASPGSDHQISCATLQLRPLPFPDRARYDGSMPTDFMIDHHAYLTLMLQLARQQAGRFDVIHNQSLHHLPIAMAPMLTTPMLTTVHTPPIAWVESALDATGGEGNRFVAVSRHTAATWRDAAGDMDVLPNGIDIDSWPMGPGGQHLVWFGRITPEKGAHVAIGAARLAAMPLVLAGPISDPAYFAAEVAPHLGHDVHYAGHLRHDQLATLVGSSAAALVTPMWDEPYGLVVAEAMSCGTPVVAFARGGIPEVVAPQAGRLVAPGDVAAMADAIPVAITLSRYAVHQHAEQRCSAAAMVDRYVHIYRTMIGATDGPHDRLLRTSPRLRSFGAGDQHHRADAPTRDRADVSECA
ncbi:MAG: glycosyltransferase family 4 protein [Mycobacterium sp.]